MQATQLLNLIRNAKSDPENTVQWTTALRGKLEELCHFNSNNKHFSKAVELRLPLNFHFRLRFSLEPKSFQSPVSIPTPPSLHTLIVSTCLHTVLDTR